MPQLQVVANLSGLELALSIIFFKQPGIDGNCAQNCLKISWIVTPRRLVFSGRVQSKFIP